jgi:hypothetical protein
MPCVYCGQPLDVQPPGFRSYCSVRCAEHQLRALGMLLHSTPQLALSVDEWHELGSSYASDLEALEQYASVTLAHGHLVAHG